MKTTLITTAFLLSAFAAAPAHADENAYKGCIASVQFTSIAADMRDKGTPLSTILRYINEGNEMAPDQRAALTRTAENIYSGPLSKVPAKQINAFGLDAIKNRCARMRSQP